MSIQFEGGFNIAIKISKAKYQATVAFYRDILNLQVEERSIDNPTVSRTHEVRFGNNTVWLDCVDNYTHSETWLEIRTPDVTEAAKYLQSKGINTCDELEKLPENMHWIMDPAGTVFVLSKKDSKYSTQGNVDDTIQPVASSISNDEATIRKLMERFATAFNSGDVDAIMKNYVPDKTFVLFDVVPRNRYIGADAYREAWVEMFTHFRSRPKIEIIDLGVCVDGNTAFGHSFMRVTGTDTQGHSVDRTVRVTDGYRKIDGNWLIAHEHISVPVDFATGKLVLPAKP